MTKNFTLAKMLMMVGITAISYGCAPPSVTNVPLPQQDVILTSDTFFRPALGTQTDAKLGGKSMWWATDFGSPGNPSHYLFAIDPTGSYAMSSNASASIMWASNNASIGTGYANCTVQVTIHQQPANNINSAAFLVFRGNLGTGTQWNMPHAILWGSQGSPLGSSYTALTVLAANNPQSGTIIPQLAAHYNLWMDNQGVTPMTDDVISAQFSGPNIVLQVTRANGKVAIQQNIASNDYLTDTAHGLLAYSTTPLFSNFIIKNCNQ